MKKGGIKNLMKIFENNEKKKINQPSNINKKDPSKDNTHFGSIYFKPENLNKPNDNNNNSSFTQRTYTFSLPHDFNIAKETKNELDIIKSNLKKSTYKTEKNDKNDKNNNNSIKQPQNEFDEAKNNIIGKVVNKNDNIVKETKTGNNNLKSNINNEKKKNINTNEVKKDINKFEKLNDLKIPMEKANNNNKNETNNNNKDNNNNKSEVNNVKNSNNILNLNKNVEKQIEIENKTKDLDNENTTSSKDNYNIKNISQNNNKMNEENNKVYEKSFDKFVNLQNLLKKESSLKELCKCDIIL